MTTTVNSINAGHCSFTPKTLQVHAGKAGDLQRRLNCKPTSFIVYFLPHLLKIHTLFKKKMEVFQAKYIPSQSILRPEFEEGRMKASIISYPPLGQVSVVDSDKTGIVFTVLLDTDKSRISGPWEVSIWYSVGDQWFESPVQPFKDSSAYPRIIQAPDSALGQSVHRLYFRTTLELKHSPVSFTIKFRAGPEQPWKWVNEEQGMKDGIVISKSKTLHSKTENLGDLVGDLNPVFKANKVSSDTPDTSVWSVTTLAKPANGEKSSLTEIKFGKPWSGNILRWFALIRIWTPWLAPRQGKNHFELDKEGVLCSFMEPGGRHLVLLAVSGIDDVMSLFKSDKNGNVTLEVSLRTVVPKW
jgi:hypothetical protein